MVDYKTINNFSPGQIGHLLKTSYKSFTDSFPEQEQRFQTQWEKEDNEAFNNPQTIGRHLLFSCIGNIPVGYFSWDDRQYPIGIVGQNCVLPDFQGHGYGKKQIEMIIKIFQDKKFREIKATTGDHNFFLSAQKMYYSCGFLKKETARGELFNLIEFYKQI